MKRLNRYLTGALILFCLNFASAQNYVKVDSLGIMGLKSPEAFWVDFDSDKFYDLVVYGADTINGGTGIYLIKNNGDSTFSANFNSLPNYDIRLLRPLDFLRDHQMDLSFTGIRNSVDSLTSVFYINTDLSLTEEAVPLLDSLLTDYYFTDLDNDTDLDLLYLKDSVLHLIESTSTGLISSSSKLIDHKVGKLFTFDINSDGLLDWMISSPQDPDTLNRIYINKGDLAWRNTFIEPFGDSLLVESLSLGKFKDSLYPDFLVKAQDSDGNGGTYLLESKGDSLKISKQVFADSLINQSFLADFNSNGTTDIYLMGENGVNYFLDDASEPKDTMTWNSGNSYFTRFGDWNLDGHLDLFQLQNRGADSLQVMIYLNDLDSVNRGPFRPGILTAVQDGEQEILAWSTSSDDFTESNLISYDLTLNYENEPSLMSIPNVNDSSELLSVPYHGSVSYNRMVVYNRLNAGNYNFRTLGVDNAFNLLGQGLGNPTDHQFAVCEVSAMQESEVSICLKDTMSFGTAGVVRHWYSNLYGPIGTADIIDYVALGKDVLYGSVTREENCDEGQLKISIDVIAGEQIELEPLYVVCSGETLTLSVSSSLSEVSWTSRSQGLLSSTNVLSFEPSEDQIIDIRATNTLGCPVFFSTRVDFSLFEPGVRDSVLTVEFGDQIQLEAFGGTRYQWTPTLGLSNAEVASPMASPTVSTTYTVAISNSQGCIEFFEVNVEVIQKGSIANLFSPNGDGNNDELKVFLTGLPSSFEFQVFNRSGVLVYSTNNASEAVSRGWDGTHSGKSMPTGVYYWRVAGNYENGQQVLLNGEERGSFTLIR